MPQPTPYALNFSFTGFQASNPSTPLPGYRVDAEFNAAGETLGGVLANLALIQRDDGQLANECVTVDSLSPAVLALMGVGGVFSSLPVGGSTGQTLVKSSAADYDAGWADLIIAHVAGLQAALDAKAALASPALTGAPTAPTAALGTNTTQLASTAFVAAAIAALVNSSPGALDTLKELADALGDDANFAATMTTALAGKQGIDADLTAIAALTTTSYGRAFLELANQAALLALLPQATAANIRAGTVDKLATAASIIAAAAPQTLTDASTVAWDMSLGFNAKVTLGGNRTFGAPTNPVEGVTYRLEVIQDGTGTRTGTWNAAFDWGSAGTPVLSTGAGKHDFVYLDCYDAATPKFRAAFNKAS